ncbi:unnamed protein product [Alternaria sp. RS040]
MVANYGSIDIIQLHVLLVNCIPDYYSVPIYALLRAGAPQRTIKLARLQALEEQEQSATILKAPSTPSPEVGGFLSRLSSLPLTREKPVRHITLSQVPGGDNIDSLGGTNTRKQPSRLKSTNQTQDTHVTTADTPQVSSVLKDGLSSDHGGDSDKEDTSVAATICLTVFTQQLIRDLKDKSDAGIMSRVSLLELSNWLEDFARRLREETTITLEWEASGHLFLQSE